MRCPHCGKSISDRKLARHLAAKGGASPKRQRSLAGEQAATMAARRWAGCDVLYLAGPAGTALLSGRLTTEHAASSYGLPVLLGRDGTPFGPAEIAAIIAPPNATPREQRILDGAERAGYRIVPA